MKTSLYKCTMKVAFMILFGITSAGAQQSVVTVQKTEGTVESRMAPEAVWIKVGQGDNLAAGATVRTGPGSSCILKWGDSHVIKLQELTDLDISRLERNESGNENAAFNMIGGKINAHIGKFKTPGSNFTVKTPMATAEVRGTDLFVHVAEDRTTTFGVTEGEIFVVEGEVQTSVTQDFIVTVNSDGEVGAPSPMPAEMKEAALEQVNGAKQEANIDIELEGKDKDMDEKTETPEETSEAANEALGQSAAMNDIDAADAEMMAATESTIESADIINIADDVQQGIDQVEAGQFEIDIYVAP